MNSKASVSEASAYDRLHPTIRRWIRDEGWTALRPVQGATATAILDGQGDVLVSAATAAGKTEAAFLPILTAVAERAEPGLCALYIGPLKALINDQWRRLDPLCEEMGIPVVRWHGDASATAKMRMRDERKGIALITPESIEAMFARRPHEVAGLLGALDYIVIDELHAFMQGPRGIHLASLLARIDALSKRPARRVALSATIGELGEAAEWLRPGGGKGVVIVADEGGGLDLQLQIKAYDEEAFDKAKAATSEGGESRRPSCAVKAISQHLHATLRGTNNLVFGRSRRCVEEVSDALRTLSNEAGVPVEFFPHHGNIAKELREDLEERLKTGDQPTTAVCTTTLELGVDIGSVVSVGQIGSPRSLSSLRQRLGRTGRRQGMPSRLRIYLTAPKIDAKSDIIDELQVEVVQSVAAIRLLAKKFVEPASTSDALATALLHQTMSVIGEKGGARAEAIFALLGGPGPFASVSKKDFAELLRHATSVAIVEQSSDGTLLLGELGERLFNSRDFYAMFQSDQEWRLVLGARTLGTIPLSNPVAVESLVVFSGRRWEVVGVDEVGRVLEVETHPGGVIPKFEGTGVEATHTRLVEENRRVYESDDVPTYLDARARELLIAARTAYRRLGLSNDAIVASGGVVHLFPWVGSNDAAVLAVALAEEGLKAHTTPLGVAVHGAEADVRKALVKLSKATPASLAGIESAVVGLRAAKYDDHVPEPLLRRFWGRRNARAIAAIPVVAGNLLERRA